VPPCPRRAAGYAWPPTANIGNPVGPTNGQITWSGYTWGVKDSGGAAVGPGPDVFVGSSSFVWTDGWGLHLNVQPQNGCNGWASSEIYNLQSLGYGEREARGRKNTEACSST
jgi:hypothetical protein